MEKSCLVNYDNCNIKKKNFNILIIDDDKTVSELLQEYLQLRGHIVQVIEEGSRSLYNIVKNNYDIIFIDYHLDIDNMDGAVLSECIKEVSKENIIFAYTGDMSHKTLNAFKNNGVNGIVYKPIEINIMDKLMDILESRKEIDLCNIKKISNKYHKSIQVFI